MGVSTWFVSTYTSGSTYGVDVFLGVYAALNIGTAIFGLIRSVLFTVFQVKAAERLHNTLLARVLRYPQSFFDTYVVLL